MEKEKAPEVREQLDKIIYLLECLVQNQSLTPVHYPDGTPLQKEGFLTALAQSITKEKDRSTSLGGGNQ